MSYNYDTTSLLSIKENFVTDFDGYLIGTLFLAPQKNIINAPYYGIEFDQNAINISKINLCKKATIGCTTSCLYHQGITKNSAFNKNRIKQARLKRTLKFLIQREAFFAQLIKEIQSLSKKAKKKGLTPAISLNGTSDILWEKETLTYEENEYKNIMEIFPEVQFFDYTKYDILKNRKKRPTNYHLTYSRAGSNKGKLIDNWNILQVYLDKGIDVAIIFNKQMKEYILDRSTYHGYKVIDGDVYNCRAYDVYQRECDKGLIIALEVANKTDINNSGFVIQTESELTEYLA